MLILGKKPVAGAHGGDKLMDLFRVLDALVSRAIELDAGAHIDGQRSTARPHLHDAIGHVCCSESTR
jgi:hypothetical protein